MLSCRSIPTLASKPKRLCISGLDFFHTRVPAETTAKKYYGNILRNGSQLADYSLTESESVAVTSSLQKTVIRQRFRLYRRNKGGRHYIHDDASGKQ